MARRGGSGRRRAPARRSPGPAAVPTTAPGSTAANTQLVVHELEGATLQARIGWAFGILATVALPLAYQWTFRPSTRPPGTEGLVEVMELAGIVAATIALLLGRRARAAGDRSTGAVWAPRLGGAAIVGYAMTIVILIARSG